MLKKLFVISAILFALHASGQNLVPNPSFEEHTGLPCSRIPIGKSEKFTLTDWRMPSAASPDIFSTDVSQKCWTFACSPGTFESSAGHQLPRTGKNMVGLYTSGDYQGMEYHEYIQCKLKESLRAGNEYYVEFWVTRSCLVETASNNIGAFFTNQTVSRNSTRSFYANPQINETAVITESKEWIKISGTFIPNKDMEYMMIGNFYRNSETQTMTVETCNAKGLLSMDEAYYYIDDIKVERTNKKPATVVQKDITSVDLENLKVDEPIVLRNIVFEFDKTTILASSFKDLDMLLGLLRKNPGISIEISGHTDDQGAREYNQLLSEERAQAIVDYLIEKGIEGERLSFVGYGSTRPMVPNDTESGRALNRRVEFVILKK